MYSVKVFEIETDNVVCLLFEKLPSPIFQFIDYSKYRLEISQIPERFNYGKI